MTPDSSSSLQLAVRGAFWGVAKNVINQLVRLGVFVILARLLGPEDFGLLALALTLTVLAEYVFVDGGWTDALASKPDVKKVDYDSVFWLAFGISVFIAGAMALGATHLAVALGNLEIADLIYWLLPLYPLAALRIAPRAILIRRFDFRAIAFASNIGAILGGLTAVALAFTGAGVWALVANQLVLQMSLTIGLIYFAQWRPGVSVTLRSLEGIPGFVSNAIVVQIARYFDFVLTRIVIGGRFGTAAVGHYSVSLDLRHFLRSLIILPVIQLVLPSVSFLRDDPERLRAALSLGLRLFSLVVFPAAVGAALIAGDVVLLALGQQWRPAVPLVELAMLGAPALALTRVNERVQYAFGRTAGVARLAIISTGLLAVLLLTVPISSATGVLALLLFRVYAMLPFHFRQLCRTTSLSLAEIVQSLIRCLAATAIMVGAVLVLQESVMLNAAPGLRITASISVGILVYIAAVWLIARSTAKEAMGVAEELLRGHRS